MFLSKPIKFRRLLPILALSLSASVSFAEKDPFCENLYKAACFDENGKNRFIDDHNKRIQATKDLIAKAQDKAAKERGFKDLSDLLQKNLAEKGITFKEPIDEKMWNAFVTEVKSGWNPDVDDYSNLFASTNGCSTEYQELNQNKFAKREDQEFERFASKSTEILQKYEDQYVKLAAQDLPFFLENDLSVMCRNITGPQGAHPASMNPKITERCSRFSEIRQDALRLFRLEGTDTYAAEAEKFVRKNWTPDFIQNSRGTRFDYRNAKSSGYGAYSYGSNSSFGGTGADPSHQSPGLEIMKNLNDLKEICLNLNRSVIRVAKNKISSDLVELNRTKTVVEPLIQKFYSKEKKEKYDRLHSETRAELDNIIRKMVSDPRKKSLILEDYDRTRSVWMGPMADRDFEVNSKSIKVLKEGAENERDRLLSYLEDPSLDFFFEANAMYGIQNSRGRIARNPEITMMPYFLDLLDEHPEITRSVLGHELGHQIDLNNQASNKYDLNDLYSDLKKCFSDSKSIKMQPQQFGETFADYFSAEILARRLAKVPPNSRRQILTDFVQADCVDDHFKLMGHRLNCVGVHPHPQFRISGVVGANPNLRKLIGCSAESSEFKTCGMKELELKESEIRRENNPSFFDSIRSKGVK